MYESQVSFTLDTVCPWTYLAKKRLDEALTQFRASQASSNITFNLHFEPYQLYSDFPETTDKQEWYLHNKHMDNPDGQSAFQSHMTSLFEPLGVKLDFSGPMGNTLNAHRVLQLVQERHPGGSEDGTTSKLVDGLYRRYFSEAKHPAADETLIGACEEAGLSAEEARELVEDKSLGERDVKQRMREVGMDTDAVPVVVVEGRRRDLTLTGAKEVKDYVKALETVAKEST